jgi:hypothetical protein
MFFRFVSKNPIPKVQFFQYSIQNAKLKVIAFPIGAEELLLDDYLKKHFNLGLKPTCLNLLNKLKANQVSNTELIFVFTDEKAEELANFITYGDGYLGGSQILVHALSSKKGGF